MHLINSKTKIATTIALLLHVIGLVGIIVFENDLIIKATSVNLLVSFSLLIWTQKNKDKAFYLFVASILILGFLIELIGVNTGLLFGEYQYGNVLGIKWKGVPFIIAVNWVILIYCCGISTHTLLSKIVGRLSTSASEPSRALKALSLITDGATIATILDYVMEPVAVKLGFWQWTVDGNIPVYNYFSWFIVSMLLLGIFQLSNFNKRNKFAVNLLLIQFMFFLILRTFIIN